jgi:hypothetical protein
MNKAAIVFGAAATLVAGGVALASAAQARCGTVDVLGSGGTRCDGPIQADGSFERCESVQVLGFGGENCYIVYAPAP